MGEFIDDFLVVELGSKEKLASRKLEYKFFNKLSHSRCLDIPTPLKC